MKIYHRGCSFCFLFYISRVNDKFSVKQELELTGMNRPEGYFFYKSDSRSFVYCCSKCDEDFNVASKLEEHILTEHIRETKKKVKLECNFCDIYFEQRKDLDEHIKEKHLHYECKNCNKKFQSPQGRTAHLRKEHPEKMPFKCEKCEPAKIYETAEKLRDHQRKNCASH